MAPPGVDEVLLHDKTEIPINVLYVEGELHLDKENVIDTIWGKAFPSAEAGRNELRAGEKNNVSIPEHIAGIVSKVTMNKISEVSGLGRSKIVVSVVFLFFNQFLFGMLLH